jgi:hypothetical protein
MPLLYAFFHHRLRYDYMAWLIKINHGQLEDWRLWQRGNDTVCIGKVAPFFDRSPVHSGCKTITPVFTVKPMQRINV